LVDNETSQRIRVINSSLQLIKKSTNPKTQLKRYDLILMHLNALKRYEDARVLTTSPEPSALIEEYTRAKERLLEQTGSSHTVKPARHELDEVRRLAPSGDPVVSMTVTSVLDENTCPLCRFLDGMTMGINHPDIAAMVPPLHKDCRCLAMYNQQTMRASLRIENYDRPPAELLERYMAAERRALLKTPVLRGDSGDPGTPDVRKPA
jgi:hypothetical protein